MNESLERLAGEVAALRRLADALQARVERLEQRPTGSLHRYHDIVAGIETRVAAERERSDSLQGRR